MPLSKHKAQILHARRRAKERFDLELTPKLRRQLIADIQAGRAWFVYRQSNRVSIWRVAVGKLTARVVYDSVRKSIVTFLPKGAGKGERREGGFHFVRFNRQTER
jgi:hypothetical protein